MSMYPLGHDNLITYMLYYGSAKYMDELTDKIYYVWRILRMLHIGIYINILPQDKVNIRKYE